MHFEPNHIYHVYNRGNNKIPIFFNTENYLYLLRKVRTEWLTYCDILCYCLMPNHFHFMLVPNEAACNNIHLGDKLTHIQNLSKTIGKTLSSYTKAVNNQNQTRGNLFQKKTKAKCLSDVEYTGNKFTMKDYALTCFHYIHQNPLQANLVKALNKWIYSSFPDYYGYRNGTLCNKNLAMKLLSLSDSDFKKPESIILNEQLIQKIF